MTSEVNPDAVEILLVDDNPHDAELAMRSLRRHHLANRVVWVKDGAEALEFVFGAETAGGESMGHAPQLVLLDLKMPKVDGHEVLRRLKADPRTKAVPVVVLTSSQEEADVLASYASGANSYIVKPVEFENFAQAVQQLGLYWLLLNRPPAHR